MAYAREPPRTEPRAGDRYTRQRRGAVSCPPNKQPRPIRMTLRTGKCKSGSCVVVKLVMPWRFWFQLFGCFLAVGLWAMRKPLGPFADALADQRWVTKESSNCSLCRATKPRDSLSTRSRFRTCCQGALQVSFSKTSAAQRTDPSNSHRAGPRSRTNLMTSITESVLLWGFCLKKALVRTETHVPRLRPGNS